MIPAPDLREVARIWWDVDREPAVTWDEAGTSFHLVDPGEPSSRLLLARLSEPVTAPEEVATALADGLAACDFPPTSDGVPPERAGSTLRAAGVRARLASGA